MNNLMELLLKQNYEMWIFIKDAFPTRVQVDKNLELYKIGNQEEGAPRGLVENEKENFQTHTNFESNLLPSRSTPLINQPQQFQLHRTMHERIPCRCFEIKGKDLMLVL